MSILLSSPLELMAEAAKAENFETNNVLTDAISSELKSAFAGIECCPIEINYTQEMVNVVEDNEEYYVEMSDVSKYMVSQQVKTVKEALSNIAECNSIEVSKINVVVESEDYFNAFLEAAKKDKKKEKELKGVAKLLTKMKKEKIKVVKKKK